MHNGSKQFAREQEQSWGGLFGKASTDTTQERRDPPEGYVFPYQVQQPLPYACCGEDGRELMLGGVLRKGAVLWLQEPLQRGSAKVRVTGFTPSAGVVGVSAQALFPHAFR